MPAISVENVSKQYRLGNRVGYGYRTLREVLSDVASAPFRRWRRPRCAEPAQRSSAKLFDALDDVSFRVEHGEIVGIVGRNGAGKSTLLKILGRITEPSSGRIELRGRVGSLLEVGTGFHPELTGRENVYLNGAILGMTRREIKAKFDEIVAFAEIDEFLDTPVKRYSSGMYVRLAFAVAAHLEPEILLVDEVLAVGDASFQRKCLDKMRDVAQTGRTVLFVSHNMDLVPRLCRTAILLDRGRIKTRGETGPVVEEYLANLRDTAGPDGDLRHAVHRGDGRVSFTRVQLLDPRRVEATAVHRSGDNLTVRVEVTATEPVNNASMAVNVRSTSGTMLHSAWTREQNVSVRLRPGPQTFECTYQRVRIRPGNAFDIELWMEGDGGVLDHVREALRVQVVDGDESAQFVNRTDQGLVLTEVAWRITDTSTCASPLPLRSHCHS
jgi:lipopolysaccharide transport system ATP-binding protein